ncbi:hypothetical protein COCSUDRAFT_44670 [Coccomyxa subellipsoidea C-169]|uniref:Uncharacterized protein n=1 Tax=Coccomyxa subellipsoidea (strain C-169) TaxID=574566 RepID=I0YLP6_COCSC|nr:hypothetical protein COCSUDRAFT_44670 [Coccomyxa subellipsoidea C-169]EIE19315.1 hypothetical protein COCSUDRAFT_44670 [Coccomyxa subellipsoidea C-169]|eukprot:XP_005643859.1 hypothetical protein COCSUDRAFT_44670 [Coccomyxa subellipsoidea C-169]
MQVGEVCGAVADATRKQSGSCLLGGASCLGSAPLQAEELGQLQNTELAASVEKERLRLARLHSRHFRQPGPGSSGREPVVSLEAFVWAHCLVRSRALDLTADQGVFHERCMLPLIDMCNHDSNDTTCSLRVRLSPSGEPRSVDLVAARDVIVGENLTLNYGGRPMRDLLRGYGFTPACAAMTDPSEVYENLGDGCQALIVQGSGKGRMFRLAEVRILPERGAYPLLELTNAATLCYEGWRQRRHTEMALQYRLQRKLLLARVADDLAAQAALLG